MVLEAAEGGLGLVAEEFEPSRVDGTGVAGDRYDVLACLIDVLALARDLESVHVREIVFAIRTLTDADLELGSGQLGEVFLCRLGDAADQLAGDRIELGDLFGDRHHAIARARSKEVEDDFVGRRCILKDVMEEDEDDRFRVVIAVLDEADRRTPRMFKDTLAVVAELITVRGLAQPVGELDKLELLRGARRQHVKELVAIHAGQPFLCGRYSIRRGLPSTVDA
jgi:hypothetical protein